MDLAAWAPNLACGLFTSGLTVYCINVVLVRREQEERDAKMRPVAHVVMLLVVPHVQSLLKEMVDPNMRLGPIGGDPKHWTGLALEMTSKIDTYTGVLDIEVMISFDRVRNALSRLARRRIEPDTQVGALEIYTLVAPIVMHLDKIRRRFFRKSDELAYGDMLPLLQKLREKHGLLDPSTLV